MPKPYFPYTAVTLFVPSLYQVGTCVKHDGPKLLRIGRREPRNTVYGIQVVWYMFGIDAILCRSGNTVLPDNKFQRTLSV